MDSSWLAWAKQLQAIAQTGLTYARDPYDIERYQAVAAVATGMMAELADAPIERVLAWFAGEGGYATPKVDVRGAVFRDGKVLLVREREDGRWTLPGGWADIGQTPVECVEREILEESGYEAKAVKLLAVYDRSRHPHPPLPFHVYKLYFLCELVGGAPATSTETDGVGFFAEDNLPELSIGRVTAGQIARFFEHIRHPDWPTDIE